MFRGRSLCHVGRHDNLFHRSFVIIHFRTDFFASHQELHTVLADMFLKFCFIGRRMLSHSHNIRFPALECVSVLRSLSFRRFIVPVGEFGSFTVSESASPVCINFGTIYERHAIIAFQRVGCIACNHIHFRPMATIIINVIFTIIIPAIFLDIFIPSFFGPHVIR